MEVSMKLLRFGLLAVALIALTAGSAFAWGDANNCVGCHTTMTAGGALHTAHNAFVEDCGWCHGDSGFTPVLTKESELDAGNSCSGCHLAGALRNIHITATEESCGCHGGDAPGLESDVPAYYGTAATTLEAWNVCFDGLDNDGDGDRDGGDTDCASVPTEWKSWSTIKDHYGD